MSIAVSPGYATSPRDYRPTDDDLRDAPSLRRVMRLTSAHAADLRDVARGVEESAVGVCTKYLLDHVSGGEPGEVSLDEVERFCERTSIFEHPSVVTWRRRITRCRRSLARLHEEGKHSDVAVLHVVYGPPDPLVRNWPVKVSKYFADLAPLARYTDTVEERRRELAWREATQRVPRVDGGVVALHRLRAKYLFALGCLSSGDALADVLAPAHKRADETLDAFHDRKRAADACQDETLMRVRRDAASMLERAALAYHAAWLTVGRVS